jgi:dTDP-4-dehydrorhamnose 3,5-epimerase
MLFHATPLKGLWVVEPELLSDERGFFARSWCEDEFRARGLNADLTQCNISFNTRAGTLRGLHWQSEPHGEAKLVRCTMGAIWDVAVDVRPASPTFGQWHAVELNAQNRLGFFIPAGFAHGFQTLQDNSEVFYQMSTPFHGPSSRGAKWDDAAIGIRWPSTERRIISEKDRNLPLLQDL